MTGRWFLFVWRDAVCTASSDLRPTLRHIALTLSMRMNKHGENARPGAETLATMTGLNVATVRAGLADLVALGWLDVVERGGIKGQRKRSNSYRARLPQPVALDDPSSSLTGRRDGAHPSSSLSAPLVVDDPISRENSRRNSSAPPVDRERGRELALDGLHRLRSGIRSEVQS